MRADLHVHTRFSCDSEAHMSEYLRQAEEKRVDWRYVSLSGSEGKIFGKGFLSVVLERSVSYGEE